MRAAENAQNQEREDNPAPEADPQPGQIQASGQQHQPATDYAAGTVLAPGLAVKATLRPDSEARQAPSAPVAAPRVLVQSSEIVRGRPVARRLVTVVAMAFAAFLAIAVSIPASAINQHPPDWVTAEHTVSGSAQTLQAGGGTAAAVGRDGYSVASPPPPPPPVPVPVPLIVIETVTGKSYAHTSNSFTNNPASPIQWPFTTGVPISDGFGPRLAPCAACSSFHKGLDMNPGEGTPIQAMADGVVSTVVSTDGGGLGVYVVIDHVIDGQNVQSWYGHMLTGSIKVTEGETVKVGQQVGNVGNTGTSTGAHLHFEVHVNGTPIDPYAWLKAHVAA